MILVLLYWLLRWPVLCAPYCLSISVADIRIGLGVHRRLRFLNLSLTSPWLYGVAHTPILWPYLTNRIRDRWSRGKEYPTVARTSNPTPANVRTLTVQGLRILASDNAEVAFVAKFFVNGKPKSRSVTVAEVRSGATANLAAGTLTLPNGKRGRRATPGMTPEAFAAHLAALAAN